MGLKSSIEESRARSSIGSTNRDLAISRPLPTPYYSLPSTPVATPYLPPKCLLIIYFVPPISSITLLLTLQQTVIELCIRPIYFIRLILSTLFNLLPF